MSPSRTSEAAAALRALSEVVSLTHFRMNAVIEALYGGGAGAASGRAVLRNVIVNGPMTVPQIAALRPVSRQYIQSVVDALAEDGSVEMIDNPAHRRSKLVCASEAGRRLIAAMDERGDPLLAQAADAIGASPAELQHAAALLTRLNRHMDALIAAATQEKTVEG